MTRLFFVTLPDGTTANTMTEEPTMPVTGTDERPAARRRGRPARAENADFKPVTFHIDREQYREISEIAARTRRSIKQTMFLVIEAGLKALKGRDS